MNIANVILVITNITTALIAGLYYSYSCSVNPGLAKLSNAAYIESMQQINIAIQNPVFFISFMGTLLLLPLSAYLSYNQADNTRFYFLLAAAIIYAVGSMGVTMMGNVPLNNALAAFQLKTASDTQMEIARRAFEGPWNKLHTIRTWATVISLALVVVACISPNKE